MANKIFYGLKNVHIAKITQATNGTITFGTPRSMPGAVNMSLEAAGDTSDFYADDTKYWTGTANNGYTGTLEMALIPEWFRTEYLGQTVDTNGNITERSTDKQAPFCMLFEFDGDEKARKHALYYSKATRPKLESETVGASIEPKTESMEFSAIPLPDGSGVIKSESGSASTNYTTWYSSVSVPTFATV